jgi:hypothetical protein
MVAYAINKPLKSALLATPPAKRVLSAELRERLIAKGRMDARSNSDYSTRIYMPNGNPRVQNVLSHQLYRPADSDPDRDNFGSISRSITLLKHMPTEPQTTIHPTGHWFRK